eukprot:2946857-Lingulodinium_polyedra.AAC.1
MHHAWRQQQHSQSRAAACQLSTMLSSAAGFCMQDHHSRTSAPRADADADDDADAGSGGADVFSQHNMEQ